VKIDLRGLKMSFKPVFTVSRQIERL